MLHRYCGFIIINPCTWIVGFLFVRFFFFLASTINHLLVRIEKPDPEAYTVPANFSRDVSHFVEKNNVSNEQINK